MAIVDKNRKNLTPEMQMLDYSKNWRIRYEMARFITQMFIEQQAYYKQAEWKLKEGRPPKNYRDVSKARTQLRGIKNMLTRDEPRRQTKHFTLEQETNEEDRRVANLYLKKVYRDQTIKEKMKDLLHNSLMKCIGFRQIYFEDWETKINEIDTFDLYLDPHWRLDGPCFTGRWMIKAIPMPVSEVNEKRPQKNPFMSDNKMAESDKKVSMKNSEEASQNNSDFWTIMVYEIYERKGWTITKKIYINDKTIVEEDLGTDKFPILAYQPERFGGKLYPMAWMDPIIEMNKSLNRIYSSLEDWVYTFSKGRRLGKRNENYSNITDENWQIVYYDNVPPVYMQQWSPGDTPFNLMWLTSQYMEDAGWTHAESMGRTSGANIRSASQISQIQAGDVQNMAEATDNLRTFLSKVGEMILEIASKNIHKTIKLQTEKGEVLDVIGSQAQIEEEKLKINDKAKKIQPFKNIIVEIVPGTAYSDLQAKDDIIALRNIWVMIPDEYIIETFKLGNTDEMLSKMRMDSERNKNPDIDIASAENKKMLMWLDVMADLTEDHRIHKAIHGKLLQVQKDNREVAQKIIEHIKQHEAFERPMEDPGMWQPQPGTEQPM